MVSAPKGTVVHETKLDWTHLIAEKLTKCEKVLASMAGGKWILTEQYVTSSHAAGHWLLEVCPIFSTFHVKMSGYPWKWWWLPLRTRLKNLHLLPLAPYSMVKHWYKQGKQWAGQGGIYTHALHTA